MSNDKYNHEDMPLQKTVKQVVSTYLEGLQGRTVINIYDMVLNEIEPPLLETVMRYSNGNQTKASIALGISSGTLRKKLKEYNLEHLNNDQKEKG